MSLVQRLRYAVYVLIVVTAVVALTLGIAEGTGVVASVSVQALMFDPLYFLPVFGMGFAFAPVLVKRMPISGDTERSVVEGKRPFGYKVRVAGLMLLAFAVAAFAGLLAYLIGRFA